MPTPIPPLLDEYIKPSTPGSLTLITSVLDATGNWLLLRFLYAAIHGIARPERRYPHEGAVGEATPERFNVVLISFLRSLDFWRNEGRRLGLDFNLLITQKRLLFIDGLSQLFLPESSAPSTTTRVPSLHYSSLSAIQQTLASEVTAFSRSQEAGAPEGVKTILVLDAPDLLLASTPVVSETDRALDGQRISASDMVNFHLSLRSLPYVHSLVTTFGADGPLIHHPSNPTPLEVEHKSCLATLAHQARFVLQLRPLGTGSARDVSGVIRVNRGGDWEEDVASSNALSSGSVGEMTPGRGNEWLYYIAGNGEAKVWGRGEAGLS